MRLFGRDFKDQVVKKMMLNHQSVSQISRDMGIGRSTLHAWKKDYFEQGYVMPQKPTRPHKWDSKAKLAAVIQTAHMDDTQRSELNIEKNPNADYPISRCFTLYISVPQSQIAGLLGRYPQ